MAIIHTGHSNKNNTREACPVHSFEENAPQPLFGNISFYHFNMILSGAAAAFVFCTMIFFLFMHATHLRKPNEQVKIMKISLIMPLYSLVSFIAIVCPGANVYLEPWLEVVQAISLSSFFLLLLEYVSPNEAERDAFFADLKIKDKKAPGGFRSGLPYMKKSWLYIFQYPVVAFLVAVFTDITQAADVYCEYLSKPYYAKLWLSIAKSVSLSIAITCILKLYTVLKPHIGDQRPLLKLLAFKLIVSLTFLLSIIFWILTDTHSLNPTDTLTYADLHVGIPKLVVCLLMVPLSFLLVYAYPWRPYLLPRRSATATGMGSYSAADFAAGGMSYQGGPLGVWAWLSMLNPLETIKNILTAVRNFMSANEGPTRVKDAAYEPDSGDERYSYGYSQPPLQQQQQQQQQQGYDQHPSYGQGYGYDSRRGQSPAPGYDYGYGGQQQGQRRDPSPDFVGYDHEYGNDQHRLLDRS